MVKVPRKTTADTMAEVVTLTFEDTNQKDPTDMFQVEFAMKHAFQIAKMLHKQIVENAADRYGVTPPTKAR